MRKRIETNNTVEFPRLRERFGEDPGRFLSGSMDSTVRIRGIRDPEVLAVYALLELRAFGGRQRVLQAIDDRAAELGVGEITAAPSADAQPRQAATDGGVVEDSEDNGDRDERETEDAPCPECNSEETEVHEVGEKRALWCPACDDFVARLSEVNE